MYKGIDVSKHNGTINWNKVKDAGIQFAIIRVGVGNNIPSQDDSQAIRNMTECEKFGIPYGVYLYSYALTEGDAQSEADHVLRMIKGRNTRAGIWLDLEDADHYKSKKGVSLDRAHSQLYTGICNAFTTKIQSAKHDKVGIYASKSVLENVISRDYLQRSDINIWVAQWGEKCTYNGSYVMWQYSSSGQVSGSSSKTDMNYYYGEF